MRHYTKKQIIWALGLNETLAEAVHTLAGPQYEVRSWPVGSMPDFSNPAVLVPPCLICFTLDSCKQLHDLPFEQIGFLELVPKALLLPEDAGLAELEKALEYGVAHILRAPLTKQRFSACLRKAAEAAALQRDIQNMAHEVFVEREMLERKNEALSFLVNFMTQINDSFNETELLGKAFICLQRLLPVMTMHAALITRDDNGGVNADLYVAAPKNSPAHEAWRTHLLETAETMTEGLPLNPTTLHLPLAREATLTAKPTDGHTIILPMHISENAHFFLIILTPMERNLSRDQTLALDSALRHMALNMKSARRYQEMCSIADRDGLTGAYNRRYFEQVLASEAIRHERYGEDLSLLILDIDHFKNVNDTWGHLKGDDVLRAVSDVIMGTIRQTDYCVRYGGEEFVVLLPHTNSANAVWLAERLRAGVESLTFTVGKSQFGISVSIGVASVAAGEAKDGMALTGEADKALYQAKEEGRNRVIVYSPQRNIAATV